MRVYLWVDDARTDAAYYAGMAKVREWLRSVPVLAQDGVLALVLSAYTQWELSVAEVVEGPMWAQRLTFLMMTGAIAGRRTTPLVAAIVGAAGMALQTPLGTALAVGGFLAVIMLTHSVALRCPRRAAVAGLVCMMAGVHLYDVLYPDESNLPDLIGNAAIFLLVWALGRGARRWRQRHEQLQDRAAAQQRQQQEQMRAAIAQERAGIARELHDIVAHGISVMVLQAGAARQVLDAQPERARSPLLAVENSGRQALEEMHRLLGILRRDDDGLALGPLASLSRLPEVVEQMRSAGLHVDLDLEGDPPGLPSSLELSAYRIVQEALTNTLKHSDSRRARVVVRYTPEAVEVDVCDDGPPTAQATSHGQGLVGMRERVALFGGEVSAGPDSAGGWTVHARLPLPAPPS
jgi:signal transduction histidine kinase